MAAARQQDVNSAMLSILKKMDAMVESTKQTYDQSLITLGSVETIARTDSAELKKQTGILISIEAGLKKKSESKEEKGGIDKGSIKEFREAFGSVSDALEKMLKAASKIDEKKGEKLKKFFTNLAESINTFSKDLDPNKAKAASDLIKEVTSGVLKYAFVLTIATPLLAIAIPGAVLFGLSLRLLIKTMGDVNKDQVEAMKSVLSLAKGAVLYSLSMLVVSVLSPIVLVGSTLFGLSVRMLMKTVGEISEERVVGLAALMSLSQSLIKYSLSMVLVTVLSPIVLVGSVLFGLSVRLLLKSIGEVNKDQVEGMHGVLAIAKGAILYSLAIAAITVLTPVVILGSVLFGLSIRLLLKATGAVDKTQVEAMGAVLSLAKGALLYSLAMVVVSVLSPIVLIGSALFGLSIRLLFKAMGTVDKKSIDSMRAVLTLARGAILYSLAMVVVSILSPVVIIGSVLFGLSIRLLLLSAGTVDEKKIKSMQAVLSLAKGALLYSLAMVVVTLLSPIVLIGSIIFGLSIRLLLKSAGAVNKNQVKAMEAVLSLAKGALLYSLAMVVVTILSPIVLIGSVLFGLSIRLLLAVSGAVDKNKVKAMQAVLTLAKGALLYSLAMVVVTLLAPIVLIGSLIFALSLRILSWGLKAIGKKEARKGVRTLLWTAVAIFAFGLVIWAFSKMVTVADALFSLLTIVGFALVFYFIGKNAKMIAKGALAMVAVSISVIFLALGLLLFKASKFDLNDALTLGITIAGLGLEMYIAGKFSKEIMKGAISMIVASVAVIILSVGLLLFKASGFQLEDALSLAAAIAAVGVPMAAAGLVSSQIMEGSISMIVASVAVIILSVGLLLFKASGFQLEDSLSLAAAIAAVGVPMAAAGLVSGLIMSGSVAMILASVSIILLSVGLLLFKTSGFKLEDSLSLGAALGTVGVTMAAAGLASPLIMLGSVAMILASVALLPITGALAVFKASGWKKGQDDENLESALGSVMNGFLGGKMPGGIFSAIKFAAKAAARALLLFVTVPPMILAGIALISISKGLEIFKRSGFKKEDGDNIEFMLGSIVKAFGIVTDYDRQKKMGFYVNPFLLSLGIDALSGAGRVLAGLAAGVQAWANLEVNEWQVINPGTKDAKLVIKNRRKLNKTDFENAAMGMAMVISAIAAPFALVGKLEKGQSSGNPFYDAIFGGGFVSSGIKALARSGDTLVSLAAGVQAWSNLQVTEYQVVGAGTKDAKIVPKGIRQLTTKDFVMASLNIGMVIGFLANEFARIGKMEKDSSGWFSGGYVSKGVSSISGLGDQLLTIAEVITKMANMEIVINTVKNGKIVPVGIKKMTPADFALAAINIGMITGFLAREIAKIGRMEKESSGWFSGGYVSTGMKAISGLGQNISAIADVIIKMANAEVTEMDVVNGKLVPKATRKMKDTDFTLAADNMNKIMSILIDAVAAAGKKIEKEKASFDLATKTIPNMTSALSDLSRPVSEWAAMKDLDKAILNIQTWDKAVTEELGKLAILYPIYGPILEKIPDIRSKLDQLGDSSIKWNSIKSDQGVKSFTLFSNSVFDVFDKQKNKNIHEKLAYMCVFTHNITTLAKPENDLTKVAENFEKIQKNMKLTKDHINAMDLKKLTLTDSLMKSLAAIAKNPEAMARAVEGGINEAFQELSKALKELAQANQKSQEEMMTKIMTATTPGGTSTGTTTTGAPNTGNKTVAPPNPLVDPAAMKHTMTQDMIAALSAVTVRVKF